MIYYVHQVGESTRKAKMKVYRIPQKYRFPAGQQIQEIRELRYNLPQFSTSSVKGLNIFSHCKNGWYVVDIVNTGNEIIATLGRV